MLSTLLVVGVISHLWCAARLVGIAHHSFYSVASVALLKLHGCVVSHKQVLATTLLCAHNLLNTHFAGPLQLKEFNFSNLFLRQ